MKSVIFEFRPPNYYEKYVECSKYNEKLVVAALGVINASSVNQFALDNAVNNLRKVLECPAPPADTK